MAETEKFSKKKLSIDITYAHVFALVILAISLILFLLPYYFLWDLKADFLHLIYTIYSDITFYGMIVCFIPFLGLILHEFIHGVMFAMFSVHGFKSIKFGIHKKLLTPYCHFNELLTVRQTIVGALAPTIILGLIPCVLAIATGNIGLLLFGIFLITTGGGDILAIKMLLKEKMEDFVEDHPDDCACFVYTKL